MEKFSNFDQNGVIADFGQKTLIFMKKRRFKIRAMGQGSKSEQSEFAVRLLGLFGLFGPNSNMNSPNSSNQRTCSNVPNSEQLKKGRTRRTVPYSCSVDPGNGKGISVPLYDISYVRN